VIPACSGTKAGINARGISANFNVFDKWLIDEVGIYQYFPV
jgi:hypothetical protein